MTNKDILLLESKYDIKIVYLTLSGSKLYGTNNENSDTDYKGIFIPTSTNVLLKQDLDFITSTTGSNNSKNTAEDIDFHLDSIYTFFKHLKKGETGALDLLYSMFDETTTVHTRTDFVKDIKENHTKLYGSNLHAFVGYCVGQSKKYNIKGKRYQELNRLLLFTNGVSNKMPVPEYFKLVQEFITTNNLQYIKIHKLAANRDDSRKLDYIQILGKNFSEEVSLDYIKIYIDKQVANFGHRAKTAEANGVDWKALSHAMRVIYEVEELLTTNFITFPLKERSRVKDVKQGNVPLETVTELIDSKLDTVNNLLETTDIPAGQNRRTIINLTLKYVT